MFVIISIIEAQNQTLEHAHQDKRERSFLSRPILSMHPYGACSHLHCLTMHTNTLIALAKERKKERINWYRIELFKIER